MNNNPTDDIVIVKHKLDRGDLPWCQIRIIMHQKGKARLVYVNGRPATLWQRICFYFEWRLQAQLDKRKAIPRH